MKTKFVKGMVNSALTVSLAFVSHSSWAVPLNTAPTDISFGLPVVIEAGHDLILVDGVGGFGTPSGLSLDNPEYIDVSSVFGAGFNFYSVGPNLTGFAIHPAGQVTLGHISLDYSQSAISGYTRGPMFSAVWRDLQAQNGNPISPGGNSTGTNVIYYHNDVVNDIVTVTWDDVGNCCGGGDVGSAFQMRFHNIGNGNFVVENRYESVNNLVGAARLGWTNGDLINFDEPFPSAEANFGNLIATTSNIDHPGVFAWMFVNGQVVPSGAGSNKVLEGSASGTAIGSLSTEDPDTDDTFTYTLLDDADGRFVLNIRNGITYVDVADGGNRLDVDDNETHDIRVRVTDSALNTFEKTLTINVIKVPAFLTSTQIDVPVDEVMNVTIKTRVEQGSAIPTVTAAGLPDWMTFADNGDGSVTLSGFASFENTFRIMLTMTDGFGNQTTRTFNINVREVNDSTNRNSNNDNSNTTTTVEVTVTDEDGNAASFGWLLLLIGGGLLARKRLK